MLKKCIVFVKIPKTTKRREAFPPGTRTIDDWAFAPRFPAFKDETNSYLLAG